MARLGNREPAICKTSKGNHTFNKFSKADFADIATILIMQLAGEDLDIDEVVNKLWSAKRLSQIKLAE